MLCSWARHFTLTMPPSRGTGESNAGGNPAMDWHPIQGGVEILLSCFMLQKTDISADLMGLLGS